MSLTGQQLGEYRVLRRLGKGAMAEVYLAEQASLARQVALKVLNPSLAGDAKYVERFQHEARAAAALVHSRIVQIYEVGKVEGYHFIAQEYVAGQNLGELIQREGRLSPGLTLDVLRQVASALHKAAERGIVHRDIKPENVMLARSGEVKVADFGLARVEEPGAAKLTQIGVTMGTPLYMSPEQIEGRPVDSRSDIYSLGVTAYHMLAGEPPFRGDTPMSVAVQHLNAEAPRLTDSRADLPVGLGRVIERMIAKSPDDRPASPAELLGELQTLATQAAEQGWANGAEPGSIAEFDSLEGSSIAPTRELSHLMQQATTLSPVRGSWGRIAALFALALAVGGMFSALLRPTPLLTGALSGTIEKKDALRQLFHAKVVGTSEEAWQAVSRLHPDADPYYHYLADQNLVSLYLRRERYDAALRICRRLAALEDQDEFRLFGLAGIVVSQMQRGDQEAAMRSRSQFPLSDVARLGKIDPQMASMFREAIQRLDDAPG